MSLRMVADADMPLVETLFGRFGEIIRRPGRGMTAADVREADVLLVRSITRVDAALLEGSRVRFVGTATIGTDHLDLAWLQAQGIHCVSAPGCNARAVVEYVLAAIIDCAGRQGRAWHQLSVGIVGAGNVGGRLRTLLEALGVRVLACDPPLAAQGVGGLLPLEALSACDVITFHTPLTRGGEYPTRHLADRTFLEGLPERAILINASRGEVVDNTALLEVLETRPDLAVVLDVWENEPTPLPALLRRVTLATPHVAGHSLEGKWRGTWQLCREFCVWRGEDPPPAFDGLLPAVDPVAAPAGLAALMQQACPLREDDVRMRQLLECPVEARGKGFDGLRRDYGVRREVRALRWHDDSTLQVWPAQERHWLSVLSDAGIAT